MTTTQPRTRGREPAQPARSSRRRGATLRGRWTGWLFVGPFMVVFIAMIGVPIIYSLYLALYRDQLVGGSSFVGLANFATLLQDSKFWESLGRVSVFFVVQVPIMLGLALVAALAIDSVRLRGRGVFRIMLFLPYAVPGVVAVLIWGFIYGDQFGLTASINGLLGSTVLAPLSPKWILVSIGNIVTWEFMGYNMLIMYSGLKTVPGELYEAAELDGANGLQIVRAIKIPAIKGPILISFIFSIIGSFQLFNEPNLLKPLKDGVISSYYTPNMYAYNLSINGSQYNYAATVAIVMGIITAVIAYVVQLRSTRSEAK